MEEGARSGLRSPVTRWQLLAAVVATGVIVGGTVSWAGGPGPTFNDVPESHPFFDEIEWMVASGITHGYPDGGYHPSEPVTRQAMSAFMQRLYDLQEDVAVAGGTTTTQFSSTTYTALTGAEAEVTIPPGVDGYVLARFSAESACSGGGAHCIVRLTIDDGAGSFVPMNPDAGTDFAFDSNDGGNESDASWEAHAIERFAVVSGGGCTCTVRVEARIINPAVLDLDDWSLVVETDLRRSDQGFPP